MRARLSTGDGRPRRRRARPRSAPLVATLALTLAGLAVGCSNGGSEPEPAATSGAAPLTTSTGTTAPVPLTFGVYGTQAEVAAYTAVVHSFDAGSKQSDVHVRAWPDHDSLIRALKGGDQVPDVFMVSRRDLAWLQEHKLTQPVDELLDERGVDFGDGYSRDALQAFSSQNRLQCMPYGISPMVIYYNKALIDFAKMTARGLDAPVLTPDATSTSWTFDQFAAAAHFASRPGKGTRGVYIDPTLRGLAPFIYGGGGTLFDDEIHPTSLNFSDGGTRSALERTLPLLRNPHVTLTESQLSKATPLQWFKRGKLGMIAGFRSLVPELRRAPGLRFDVMPMPTLDSASTIGDVSGLCLSAHAASTAEAADFLVNALSSQAVRRVVKTGYLAPANLEVALSDDFLQPGREPARANVFNSAVRAMHMPPLLDSWSQLETAVAPSLQELLSVPVLNLDAITAQIDAESRPVLSPPTPSPGSGASQQPSGSSN